MRTVRYGWSDGQTRIHGKELYHRDAKTESADNGGAFGALITDLSRAFDCLHRELLLGNLEACGFYLKPMRLIPQFL